METERKNEFPLGLFESFEANGALFHRETESIKLSPEPLDDKDDRFWGFNNENSKEICETNVKIGAWMDSLKVCNERMEYFNFERSETEQKRSILVRHNFREVNSDVNHQQEDESPKRGILFDIPLSPETQKKNELCSYLQLMNMNNTDKKTVSAIQNRRSNRVKNLKIMSEKKSMEQKLLAEFKESLEKKSFVELGMVVKENFELVSSNSNSSESLHFKFKMIPNEIVGNIKDFDESIMECFGRDIKRKLRNENKNSYNNQSRKGKIKEREKRLKSLRVLKKNLKREKKEQVFDDTFNNNSNRKLLRSSINLNNVAIKSLTLKEKIKKIKSLRSSVNLNNVGIKSLTLNERKIRDIKRKKLESMQKFLRKTARFNKPLPKDDRKTKKKHGINVKIKMNNERINNNKRKTLTNVKENKNDVKIIESNEFVKSKEENTVETSEKIIINYDDKITMNKDISLDKESKKVEKSPEKVEKNLAEQIKSTDKNAKGEYLKTLVDNNEQVNESKNTPKKTPENMNCEIRKLYSPTTARLLMISRFTKDLRNNLPFDKTTEGESVIKNDIKTKKGNSQDFRLEKLNSNNSKLIAVYEKDTVKDSQETNENKSKDKNDRKDDSKSVSENLDKNKYKKTQRSLSFDQDKDKTPKKRRKTSCSLEKYVLDLKESPENSDESKKLCVSVDNLDQFSSKFLPVKSITTENSISPSSLKKLSFKPEKPNPTRNPPQDSFNIIDLSQQQHSNLTTLNYNCWQEHNYMKSFPELDIDNFNKEFLLNESSSCSELSTDGGVFLKESYKEIPRINSVPPTDIFEPKLESVSKTHQKSKKKLHKLLMEKIEKDSETNIIVDKNRNKNENKIENRNESKNEHNLVQNENCFDQLQTSNSIRIDYGKGKVLGAHYFGYNLVLVQEQLVSFWTQSPLGNMLGAQNLWVSKGNVQRLPLDNNYTCKESREVVVNLDNKSCAYIELWTKEHKSEKRELPLADVFATVYFWTSRNSHQELNKKLLQLANIKGNIEDVQYVVLRSSRKVIVSWVENHSPSSLTTTVTCYTLSPDYQTILNVLEMSSVNHYIRSLHTIGDCGNFVVGFGENALILWELEYGEVFETVEINQRYSNPKLMWLERDRGLLFFIQYHSFQRLLMLVAVNGYSKESKRLQVFRIPTGYEELKGLCVDNNMLGAVFENGLICWNIKTGDEIIAELSTHSNLMSSNKQVIEIRSGMVEVSHFQSYFLTNFDLQS